MIKRLTLLILLILSFNMAKGQWVYLGNYSDTCDVGPGNFTIKHQMLSPSSGDIYSVYYKGTLIATGGGGLGCCRAIFIQAYTDDIFFLITSFQGLKTCSVTKDRGKTWRTFSYIGNYYILKSLNFVNEHTGYAVFSDTHYRGEAIITRLSDISGNKDIFTNNIANPEATYYLNDTIFTDPDHSCPVDTLLYKISKDGKVVDVYIKLVKVPLTAGPIIQSERLGVFPNPAKDFISVKSNDAAIIKIYNTDGKLMQEETLRKGTSEIDVSQLSPGMFFIQLIIGKEIQNTKLIISK